MTEPFLEQCLAFDDRGKISLAPCYIGVRSFLCSRHHGTHLGLLLQNTSWQCTSWHCTSQRTQIAGWVRNTTVASCISCIQSATLPAKNHPWSHFVPRIQRAGSFLRYLYEICCSLAQRKQLVLVGAKNPAPKVPFHVIGCCFICVLLHIK